MPWVLEALYASFPTDRKDYSQIIGLHDLPSARFHTLFLTHFRYVFAPASRANCCFPASPHLLPRVRHHGFRTHPHHSPIVPLLHVSTQGKLDADPDIQTSLRWLTTSPSNPLHRVVLYIMRKLKIMRRDEIFDPTTMKTKIIFMLSQLLYTIIVALPTPFLYHSKRVSVAFALVMFLCALWNRWA